MRYALVVCADESAEISEEEMARREAAYGSFADQMRARGVLAGGQWLGPAATAATVRCWDGGDVIVTGGPFARTREQVTGFLLVECQDLDEANRGRRGGPGRLVRGGRGPARQAMLPVPSPGEAGP